MITCIIQTTAPSYLVIDDNIARVIKGAPDTACEEIYELNDFLLLETGDYLLLESGGRIELEE